MRDIWTPQQGTDNASREGFADFGGDIGDVFGDPVFLDSRFRTLVRSLESMGRVVVAYSGGVDSVFLLRVAKAVLGDNAVGVLGISESLDRHELDKAQEVAREMGVEIETLETREYDNPLYRQNDASRCYHCKTELFGNVKRFAEERGIPYVLDGSNSDDAGDYRPGFRARNEQGVRSPLLEAGLDKESIRRFSRALGLPTWDKPAAPCLASRIPYGQEVSHEKLREVEAAEKALRDLGFRVVRVRHHGEVARVEVPSGDLGRILEPGVRAAVSEAVKRAGFHFATVDLEGFRSGSLNEVLNAEDRARGTGAGAFVPLESLERKSSEPGPQSDGANRGPTSVP